ncbi:caspase family protein [Labrenzia sp. 011]|uniref:caspase family protein n=1 Tax=Labrenzia sp. 011 TaxID=2171494 RepID=UPI001056E93B|nr:caspase family protein [Labrenzia sp. 011]
MNWLVVRLLPARMPVLACGLLLVALCCGPASAEGEAAGIRMALVIGNSNYVSEKLPNAGNDAQSIATTLQTLDFDVRLVLDATRDRFIGEIEEFADDTLRRNASVVLVYYAGHGVQLAGKNYFIPVDAHISDIDSLVAESVQFDHLLNQVGKSSSFKMIFLDACQNNPFQDRIGSVGVGLAPPPDVSGFLIGFATQPGKVAYDGAGNNSPYTSALLANMHVPGQEVLSVLAEVNRHVRKDTGGAQVPYVQFSVKPEFYFLPGEKADQDVEVRLWKLAAQQADPELINLYVERYPEGRFAGEARTLLDKAEADLAGRGTQDPENRDRLEEEIWTNALASRNGSLLEYYIERFPNGRNLEQAKELVTQLAPGDEANISPAELCRKYATHPNDSTVIYRGVSLERLARNSAAAVKACEESVRTYPEDPHYKALLARALAAGGDTDRAVDFYKQAALAGNTRALVSLGLFYELGQSVPKNLVTARALFEEAYSHGSTDGAINLAVSLYSGTGGERDVPRAIALLEFASSEGAARATYNLGVFAKEGVNKSPENAVAYFELAARQGYAEGALAAAAIYDEGFHTERAPQKASELLLSALTSDNGEILSKLAADADSWSRETILSLQSQMKTAGYYEGTLDGVPGPQFNRGLELWRLYGGSPS